MTSDGAPSWQQRLDARQGTWFLVFLGIFSVYWFTEPLWSLGESRSASRDLVSVALGVMFLGLLGKAAWAQRRVARWDAEHPGMVPLGPTTAEAVRARRRRLASYAFAGAVAVAALVVMVLADSWDVRGPLIIVTGVIVLFVLLDASRSERPAETVVEPYPGPGEVDPSYHV